MSKVLVVGPNWLGDMIMSQSLFKILHKQGKSLDVLAPKWNHAILECMPEVDKCIELPFEHRRLDLVARYKFAKQLSKQHYDECIVIPNSFKSALIPYWAGIPKRTGWLGELRYGVLNNTIKLNKQLLPLMVQRIIALAYLDSSFKQEDVNSLEYPYPSLNIEDECIQKSLTKYNISNTKNIIALAPGAAYGETKKWPQEYFVQIINDKIKDNFEIILLGSIKDKDTTDKINQLSNHLCVNLAGKLALPETVALIAKSKLLISNDSGLLHVAAATNTPLIGIYGSTSPDFTPPLTADDKKVILKPSGLACSPCFKPKCKYGHLKCLYDIKPNLVLSAINNLI